MSTTSTFPQFFLIDPNETSYSPGVAICAESGGASGGAINAVEIQDGTEVTISVAGSGAQPGDVLKVFIDNVLVAEHILDASEISNTTGMTTGTGIAKVTISADVLKALTQGGHSVTSQIAYSDGSFSNVSTAKGLLSIDTIGPNAPIAPVAIDDVGQTVGVIAEGSVTDDAKPLISGTLAAKYNTLEVFDNGVSLGKATINTVTGKWSLTPTTALTDGPHAITVVEYDRAGNPSPVSAPMNFTVDTGAASVAINNATDNAGDIQGRVASGGVTDDTTPTFVGTAKANTVVTISEGATVLGTATADSVGHWSFTPTGAQTEGTHTYTASITVAGNTTTSDGFAITVDTTGPVVVVTPLGDNLKTAAEAAATTGVMTITSEVDSISTVTFVGQRGQVVKTVTNNGTAKPVVLTAADLTTLGEGAVEVTTVTKDKAGNTTTTADGADGDFTLDTVAAVAVADVVNTTEDVISTTGNVGTNDTSKDGSESYSLVGSATGLYGTLVLGANGAYTYTRTANLDAIQTTAIDTFAYQVRDGAGNTTQSTLKINMAPVNDAAVIGGVSSASVNETNTAQTATGTLTITDVDSAATFVAQANVTGTNGYGKFSLTSAGVWTYTMNTAHDEFAAGVNYTDSFTATSADGTTKLVTVTMKGTNDQPTFTSTATISLSTTEDTAYNFVIANSLVGKVTDVDAGASVKGIAISWNQAPIDQGVWEWSTDGSTWTAVPADITGAATSFNNPANALYLNASDRLRFTPAANWNGNVNALVFRVADDTMPATVSGTRLNVSSYNGSTGPMSLSPSSYTLSVSAANDAPVVNQATVIDMTTQLEDAAAPVNGNTTAGTAVSSLVGALSDVDPGALKGIAITAISGAGTLYYTINNGSTWTAINNADIGTGKALLLDSSSRVFFKTSANWNGYNDNVIWYRGWDETNLSSTVKVGDKVDVGATGDGSGLNGGTSSFSALQGKVGLTVTAVNDAPVNIVPSALTTQEDIAKVITGLQIADVDAGTGAMTVTLSVAHGTISLAAGTGVTLTTNGTSSVQLSGTVTAINALLATANAVTYTPALNYNGSDTFTMTTSDGGNTGTGGVLTATSTVAMTVTAVNDAPVIVTTANSITTQEDTATTFVIGTQLTGKVTDVDGTALKGIVIVQNTTTSGTWAYSTDGGTTWVNFPTTYLGSVDWTKVMYLNATDSLRYTPAANANGANLSDLNFRAVDASFPNTASGTQVSVISSIGGSGSVSGQAGHFTVSVNAVNDAPIGTNDTASATEASGVSNATAGSNPTGNVLTNDVDVDNVTSTLVIKDILKGTTGTATAVAASTTSANGTSIVGTYGTLVIGADGSYTYSVNQSNATVQALNTTSAPLSDVFTYTVKDPSGLTGTATITVSVNGANDAAVIGGVSTATLTETNAAQTATGTLTITDVDSAATFAAQSNTAGSNGYGKFSLTTAGAWTYTMNTAHDEFVAGTAYTDSFTAVSADGTAKLVTVTINGTNDAAVVTPNATARSYTENAAAIIANNNVTLVDAENANLVGATVQITSGLTAGDTLAFTAGNGITGTYDAATGKLSLAGSATVLQYQTALQSVVYSSTSDNPTASSASRTLKWQVNDGASANNLSNLGSSTINVVAVNDAAVIGGTATASLTETNVAQTATGTLTITDVDSAATFVAQTNVAGSNGYGKFSVTSAGVWTYAMNTAHDEFLVGQVYTDSITVASADGTTKLVTVSITGSNHAPTLSYVDTGSSSTDAITNNAAMGVSSLEAAATWEYQVDNGAWTVGTGTAFTMSEGQHTYNVRQKDVLNHVSASASKTVTLDTVAPNAAGIALASDAGISNTDGVTNNGTLNIALSSDTNNWQYTTNGGTTWSNGTGATLGLAAGTYAANSVQVQAFDKAGNATLSKYASAVTVDTSAPTVSVAIGNSSLQYGQSTTVSFNFSEAVYGFANSDVSVSGGSLSNITGSGRSYSATYTAGYSYNGGSYVSVNANTYTDQAGNNGGSGSTGSFNVGVNVADVARGMSLYVTGYGHGWCDTQGWIGVGLWGNNDLQGATVTLYDGWGHSWSSNVAGSGGSTNFGTFSGGGNDITRFHADISYGGQTASVGGGVAYEVTWRGLIGLGFFNCIKCDTAYTFCYSSPIVLDLNGDGVQTVDTAQGVQFDMSGDGHKQSVGWVDKHDALLVRDINHDGRINNGTELFGSDTVLKNGQKAGDGWGALADMDSNADGKIDAQDAAFADMQVWVDANGDGVTDAGELRGLIDAGIQSIDVTHANSNTTQNGNVLFGTGQFTKADGTSAALTDAWFQVARTLALDFTQIKGQPVDMSDEQAQTVTLDFKELMAYTELHGALQISGDAADAVEVINGGAAVIANRQVINGQVFNTYDLNFDGVNDLLIAQAMNQAQLF